MLTFRFPKIVYIFNLIWQGDDLPCRFLNEVTCINVPFNIFNVRFTTIGITQIASLRWPNVGLYEWLHIGVGRTTFDKHETNIVYINVGALTKFLIGPT